MEGHIDKKENCPSSSNDMTSNTKYFNLNNVRFLNFWILGEIDNFSLNHPSFILDYYWGKKDVGKSQRFGLSTYVHPKWISTPVHIIHIYILYLSRDKYIGYKHIELGTPICKDI